MNTSERIADRLRGCLAGTNACLSLVAPDLIEVSGSPGRPDRRIEVRVRDSSDFDIAFHVPEKKDSPFVQVITGPVEEADDVQADVLELVSNLVTEHVVLGMDRRFLRGGRQFVPTSEIASPNCKHFAWVASWSGTHDGDSPAT